jgi:hypothetical protein
MNYYQLLDKSFTNCTILLKYPLLLFLLYNIFRIMEIQFITHEFVQIGLLKLLNIKSKG